jgi:MarR family transcriptional regulator, lower aerobic nicotinate degradation pathway regulator
MSMDDVYRKPGYLFRRMQQIAVAIFMEECAEFELTPVQYAALVAIREHPGIDATRLSAVIAFDRSTIGDVLERLESKGLIARRATRDDKRVKLLELKPRGRKTLAAIMPAIDRAQERMLAPLGASDRRKLMQLLAQLVDLNNASSRAPRRTLEAANAQSAGRART